MQEPFGSADPLQWRIYCDFLEESQATASVRKFAIRTYLGLLRRPELALVSARRMPAPNPYCHAVQAWQQ